MQPFYSYQAINALSLGDTGHFVFLDSWSISLLASILSQGMPLYYWMNDQHPLSQSEQDDLENKLATAGGQLMQSLVGLILPSAGGSVPQGTLVCDGSTHLRSDYPALYETLDTAFHVDADHFKVPDLRDKFIMGASASHLIGATGGSDTVTQTVEQMPAHIHTSPPHVHSEVSAVSTLINGGIEAPASAATPVPTTTGATAVTIDSAGGGEPMTITPPFVALLYVVVAL